MSKQNKQATALLAILVMGFILGLLFAPPTTVTVEKQVDKVVEKPVEKLVEIESNECKVVKNNYEVATEALVLKSEGLGICADIIGNYDYYINNLNALNQKVSRMEAMNKRLIELEAQYK